jgi:sugar lactone lactonase YvrE
MMSSPTTIDCRVIGLSRDRVGESPVWDAARGALYWVDAAGSLLHRYIPLQERHDKWQTPFPIGAVAPREGGGAILVLQDGFYAFDFADGRCVPLQRPEQGNNLVRFNDGKIDRQGRFIAGTAVQTGVQTPLGLLYRLNADLSLDVLERDIAIANGPCFSPDGTTFYFADSPLHQIFAYDYDTVTGAISNKRTFIDTHAFGSIPDGATVDSEGCIWVAFLEKDQLGRFDSDGRLDRLVDLPIRYPTSLTFGGEKHDTLFVTSISHSLSGRFVATGPDAGGIFAVTDLGVTGIAERAFVG